MTEILSQVKLEAGAAVPGFSIPLPPIPVPLY
jgi:hypothetical protein